MKGSREIWDSWIARMGLREGFFFFYLGGKITWLYAGRNNPLDRKT